MASWVPHLNLLAVGFTIWWVGTCKKLVEDFCHWLALYFERFYYFKCSVLQLCFSVHSWPLFSFQNYSSSLCTGCIDFQYGEEINPETEQTWWQFAGVNCFRTQRLQWNGEQIKNRTKQKTSRSLCTDLQFFTYKILDTPVLLHSPYMPAQL